MGGKYSCPICSKGGENNHSTTVSLFAFSWTSWHAQLLSVGLLIGVVLVVSLICFCGTRFLDCLLPRRHRQKKRRHGSNSRDTSYNRGFEPRHYAKQLSTCQAVSLPLQHTRYPTPMEQPSYHSHPPPTVPVYGFDVEAVKWLELQHLPTSPQLH